MAGQFMWFDLGVTDAGQVREFYRALSGWAVAPAADAGPYQAWITDGEQPWAGIVHADPAASGGWLPYVVVQDLDQAAKRAVSLGATVIAGSADGPAGTSVTIADPGGARLALFKPHAGQG
jgi:predicted enzyme related to lactoylglutathione lyase